MYNIYLVYIMYIYIILCIYIINIYTHNIYQVPGTIYSAIGYYGPISIFFVFLLFFFAPFFGERV